MKFSLLIILSIIISIQSYAQGEWNNWYFGTHAAMIFSSGIPTALPASPMAQNGGIIGISVSDSTGNLLFYSDGKQIYNRNNNLMPNGSGLLGGSSSCQTVIAVPNLANDTQYFIFTVGSSGAFGPIVGLHYSILDMQLDGGLGDIVPGNKNIPLQLGDSAVNQLTSIRHQNNKFIWVVTLRHGINKQYLAYLVDSVGIHEPPIISNTELKQPIRTPSYPIRISPLGNHLVCSDTAFCEVSSFDNSSGIVTPRFTFNPYYSGFSHRVYGKEFSIDSRYLYVVNTLYTSPIFQYDISSVDSVSFMQSQLIIGEGAGVILQSGPDGKIYITNYNSLSDSLNRINYPSLQGLGCGYEKNAFSLEGNAHNFCLPQFLQRYKAYIHYAGHCQFDSVQFWGDIHPSPDSLHWDFGDPSSGSANVSIDTTPSHIYTLPGQYTIELFIRHIDNRTDTSWITITIDETPDPDLGTDQTICQGDSITLDAGSCTGCTYEWSSIPPGFTSAEQTVVLNQPGIYTIAVTNTNGCTGRDTMQIAVTLPPIISNSPLSKSICSGESTGIQLESNIPNTTFAWTAFSSSPFISGYGPGTGDTIDQILTNTSALSETVTYTITPSLGDCQGDSVEFVVTVTPGDSVLVTIFSTGDSICEGTQLTYIATPIQGGSNPTYQWNVNGVNQGASTLAFTFSPMDKDTISCTLTSSDTVCISNNPATSNQIITTVFPNLPVSISIAAPGGPVCEGDPVTITATTTHIGTLPTFQWFVGGNPTGPNDSVFTYIPSDGDQVYCILTSSEQCTTNNPAVSDTIQLIVSPLSPVSITINASENPVCGEIPVTYTATQASGGTAPFYQWKVNAINAGMNNAAYTYIPVNGDVVTCILTSNAECVINNPASSNLITMSVGEAPTVIFPVCFDTITTLNAQPFKLKGGTPLGGTYSGPGVDQVTDYFNPAMAGLGVKAINYSYTNQFNCSNQSARTIHVISPLPFTCCDTLIDIRDNQHYPTVQIGTQCWMASNLNYGSTIPLASPQRDNCISEKYVNQTSFYQWDELMRYQALEEIQGFCPPGWHVPSESDWNVLFTNYTNNAFAGAPLKYSGYSGFNAILTGTGFFNTTWDFPGFATLFWSSTSHGPYKAWSHGLNEYNFSVSYYPSYRSNAFSIRCILD